MNNKHFHYGIPLACVHFHRCIHHFQFMVDVVRPMYAEWWWCYWINSPVVQVPIFLSFVILRQSISFFVTDFLVRTEMKPMAAYFDVDLWTKKNGKKKSKQSNHLCFKFKQLIYFIPLFSFWHDVEQLPMRFYHLDRFPVKSVFCQQETLLEFDLHLKASHCAWSFCTGVILIHRLTKSENQSSFCVFQYALFSVNRTID